MAVPSHLYKALLIEEENGSLDAWAVLMPNEKPPASATISDYLVTVDKLEQVTGLDFFPGLEDSQEEALESKDHVDWPW